MAHCARASLQLIGAQRDLVLLAWCRAEPLSQPASTSDDEMNHSIRSASGSNAQVDGPDTKARAVPLRGRRSRRLLIGFAIILLAAAIAWLEHAPLLSQIGEWWALSDPLAPADAIVVLGGDLEVRPFAAAALYKDGLASTILVSNVPMGRAELLGFIPSHTELNRDILIKLGIPERAIVTFGRDNSNTFEEADAVRAWALQARAKRIIVPTESFAARRTRFIFDRELNPEGVAVIVHAFPPADYPLTDWWHSRHGLVDFNDEVLKYVYYRLAY